MDDTNLVAEEDVQRMTVQESYELLQRRLQGALRPVDAQWTITQDFPGSSPSTAITISYRGVPRTLDALIDRFVELPTRHDALLIDGDSLLTVQWDFRIMQVSYFLQHTEDGGFFLWEHIARQDGMNLDTRYVLAPPK